MNFSKLTAASFFAQALLFLDLVGTNRVLCATSPLEEQKEETLKGADYNDKGSSLRGNSRFLSNVDIASSGGDNAKQFLVKFKGHDRFKAADMELQSDPHQIMSLPENDVVVMILESKEEIQYWEQREDVEYVEKDHEVYPFAEDTPWGINAVKALSVSDSKVSNRKVCIIDSGYDINHPDLQSSRSIVSGKNLSGESEWDRDGSSHGTHVAGTVAAIGGNDRGVVGVNRNGQLRLHIVKVFGSSGGTSTSTVIQGFNECVSAGANVINMSLGGGGFSQTFNDAISNAYNRGILVVASAGNDGDSEYNYPASYPSAMSVAAIDSSNRRASFSQFNDQVDIAAPGVSVLSTVPGGSYGSKSGTSMASPHVAGVAALVWSHFPTKTARQIREALESTAQDLGSSGRDNFYGHGLVRADLAYNSLKGSGPAPTPTPGGAVLDNFDFFPFMDSSFNDIGQSNGRGIEAFAEECLANPACRGFNSNGWLKHTMRPRSEWNKWTEDPTKGLYIRKSAPPTSGKCNSISPNEYTLTARFGKSNHCYRIQVRSGGKLLVDTKDPGCNKFNAGSSFRGVSVSNYQRTTTNGTAMYQGAWSGSIELMQDPSLNEAKFEVSGNASAKTFSGTLTVPNCNNN